MSQSSASLSADVNEFAKSIAIAISENNTVSGCSKTDVKCKNNVIFVDFAAQQITHLRASLNSTLRLIHASYDSLDVTRTR